MGPHVNRTEWSRRKEPKPSSAYSPHAAAMELEMRREDPPNGCARLMCAAAKGGKYKEGGREASEVTENPRGSHQGVGRGVELPQGNNTPGVTEFPRGMKPPEGPPRERAHRGRTDGGGEETPPPPTTRATGVQGDGGRDDELMGGPRMAAPPHPQQVTAADDDRSETPPKHTTSAPRVRLTGANGDGGRPS